MRNTTLHSFHPSPRLTHPHVCNATWEAEGNEDSLSEMAGIAGLVKRALGGGGHQIKATKAGFVDPDLHLKTHPKTTVNNSIAINTSSSQSMQCVPLPSLSSCHNIAQRRPPPPPPAIVHVCGCQGFRSQTQSQQKVHLIVL